MGMYDEEAANVSERLFDLFGDMSKFFEEQNDNIDNTVYDARDDYDDQAFMDEDNESAGKVSITEGILNTDIPERYYVRNSNRKDNGFTLEDEAAWIYRHVFYPKRHEKGCEMFSNFEKTTALIVRILYYVREEFLEIGYLKSYKREWVKAFTEDELNQIDDWDKKWDTLSFRRKQLLDSSNKLHDKYKSSTQKFISNSKSQSELDVAQAFILSRLMMGSHRHYNNNNQDDMLENDGVKAINLDGIEAGDESNTNGTQKEKRKDEHRYISFSKDYEDVYELYRNLGLSSREFGENLYNVDHEKYTVIDSHYSIKDIVYKTKAYKRFKKHLNENNTNNDDNFTEQDIYNRVIGLFYNVTSQSLSYDINVRRGFLKIFESNVVINTKPTEKGVREIDQHHPYYCVKRLQNISFADRSYNKNKEQWIHIMNAEKAGLIEVIISGQIRIVDKENIRNINDLNFLTSIGENDTNDENLILIDPILEKLSYEYISHNTSEFTNEWNEARIIYCSKDSYSNDLYPYGSRHIRRILEDPSFNDYFH